ncbi:MAG TPA: polysaccharide deacetylase family protein [Candidatus Methanoperedens sp.]
MRKKIAVTIDVEQDCPPYLNTYRGIEDGLTGLCSVLDRHEISATFFITGDAGSRYPLKIGDLAERHEIGCHGYSHKNFGRMSCAEAEHEIKKSTEVLCRLARQEKIYSFRAPNLDFPERFLEILESNGYLIDSSLAKYKPEYLFSKKTNRGGGLLRIPVSATSSLLRFPFGKEIIRRLSEPVVLFFHPWEFVSMQGEPVRWDCKIGTGRKALSNLEALIEIFKKMNYDFCTISDFLNFEREM